MSFLDKLFAAQQPGLAFAPTPITASGDIVPGFVYLCDAEALSGDITLSLLPGVISQRIGLKVLGLVGWTLHLVPPPGQEMEPPRPGYLELAFPLYHGAYYEWLCTGSAWFVVARDMGFAGA